MRVVVYGNSLSDTARIWWFLKYAGVPEVSMLNGGWDWWIKKKGPADTSATKIPVTAFKPEFQTSRVAEIDSLKLSLNAKSVKAVDARSDEEFDAGRIPDAVHLEWKELVAEEGRFKTRSQLQKLFRERGILPSETAVCY